MKTTSDISAFVKRNDNFELKIMHVDKKFIVRCGGEESRSLYLDDALENLAESMRRNANAMTPMRDAKPEPVTRTVTVSATASPPISKAPTLGSLLPSISQAAQQAYQQGQSAPFRYCSGCAQVLTNAPSGKCTACEAATP